MRRASVAVGVVLLVVALALALMPFNEGAARCGPPILGAEAPAQHDGLVLVIQQGCTEPGVRRLVLGAALFVAGIVTTALALCLSGTNHHATNSHLKPHDTNGPHTGHTAQPRQVISDR